MKLARVLPVAGLAVLLAAVLFLALLADRQRAALSAEDASARSQLVADGLAQRIERAAALGIPLKELKGVDQVFDERIAAITDIIVITLEDASGAVLVRRAQAGAGPADAQSSAPVRLNGATIARVRVARTSADTFTFLHRALALAGVAAVFALLAAEVLRLALARTRERREAALALACRALSHGDFTRRLPLLPRHDFDLRVPWLAAQLRHVHERQLRVSRLVGSLRKTEPDAQRRAELDALQRRADGVDRFPAGAPEALPLADTLAARSRALGVALGLAAWIPAAFLAAASADVPTHAQWGAAVVVTLVAALACSYRIRNRPLAHWSFAAGAMLALLIAGPGLAAALAVVTHPHAQWPWTSAGTAFWSWLLAAACTSLATDFLRRRARHVAPPPAAALTEPVRAA